MKSSKLFNTPMGLLGATVLLAAFFASPIQAETTECIAITSIPTVITTQGVHCFTKNLATSANSGNMIDIQVNNVTIDMNGFKLGGLSAGDDSQAIGIFALNRKNITLRNGNIRGFSQGIMIDDQEGVSSGHLLEDLILDGNLITGMRIKGSGIIIRNNRIVNTGKSTPDYATDALGIVGHGLTTSQIRNNIITGLTGGDAIAIDLRDASAVTVTENTLFKTIALGFGGGIYSQDSSDILLEGNTIAQSFNSDGREQYYGFGIYGTRNDNLLCINNRVFATQTDDNTCTHESGTLPAPL